ncbi:MAG: FAD-dependent oxidoreductase [Gammaproteobacteria bacterium]
MPEFTTAIGPDTGKFDVLAGLGIIRKMHVVVIGAGLAGITSTYFLRQQGLDVTVLEQEAAPAQGASYGNGGFLQTSAPEPWNMPGIFSVFAQAWLASLTGKSERSAFVTRTLALPGLVGWGLRFLKYANAEDYLGLTVKNMRLALYSQECLRELNNTESLSYSYRDCGAMFLHRSEESLANYRTLAEHVGESGVRYEVLDRTALLEKEPSLTDIGDQLVGAVFYPDDSSANSCEFCQQLAGICSEKGVKFLYGAPVNRIATNSNGVVIRTADNEVPADALVIAAGAHSTRLAKLIGVRLPIAPAKGYSISIPMRDWDNPPRHVLGDMGVHAGVNAIGDVLRVAGTAEFAGMREGVSKERTEYLIGLTRQIFPAFAETIDPDEIDPWGGLRPLSADGLPMIGSTAVKNIYVNSGHGGLGWTQAAGSGRAIAEHIAGVVDRFDLADFSPQRF